MGPLFFVILTGLLSQVVAGPLAEFLTKLDGKLLSAVMRNLDYSHELECFSASLMKSMGVLDANGKISPDGIIDVIQKYSTESAVIEKGQEVVHRCGTEANEETEMCSTVLKFNKCIQETVLKNPKFKSLPEFNITLPPITLVFAFISLL